MVSGRSSKNSELLEPFHIHIIYHQRNISRAILGWLWERPSNEIVRSAAVTNSIFLPFFVISNCQAIQSHGLGPKWSISKQLEKNCQCLEAAHLLSSDLPFMVICLIHAGEECGSGPAATLLPPLRLIRMTASHWPSWQLLLRNSNLFKAVLNQPYLLIDFHVTRGKELAVLFRISAKS